MIGVSIRRLSVFKAVVDLAGMNAAASQLGIAQPSVSSHIKALEQQLGTPLFIRQRGRRLRPTTAGLALYDYARDAMSKSQEFQVALGKASGMGPGDLVVAAQRTLANNVLPSTIASFLQHRPGARISVHSETQDRMSELVRLGEIDVGILFAVKGLGIATEVIGHQQLVFIASPRHPLAGRERVEAVELGNYPFVGGLKSSQFFGLIRDAVRSIGLQHYDVVVQLQDTNSIKNAVAHNLGIACTLLSAVQDDITRGELIALPVAERAPRLPVCCFRRVPEQASDLAAEFVLHLKERAAAFTN